MNFRLLHFLKCSHITSSCHNYYNLWTCSWTERRSLVGTDLSFYTKTGKFIEWNAGLSFSNADTIAALIDIEWEGDTLNASYYPTVNPFTNTAVGAEVTHSFSLLDPLNTGLALDLKP